MPAAMALAMLESSRNRNERLESVSRISPSVCAQRQAAPRRRRHQVSGCAGGCPTAETRMATNMIAAAAMP